MTLAISYTEDMEAAARSLAERHRNVLVLMDYKSVRPIRMQTNRKLGDLDITVVFEWKPGAQDVVDRWRNKGGILQYRSNPNTPKPVCPSTDAMLFVECPMQWDMFEHKIASARQEVVIYRPPSWELHERTIEHLYPSRENYQTLEAYLDALEGVEQTEYLRGVAAGSKFKRSVAFTASDINDITGWDEKFLRFLLRRYKWVVHRWHPYRLRFTPDDKDLLWAWDLLKGQPEVDRKTHALRFDTILPRIRGFNAMLKRLRWGSYIEPEEVVYVADADRRRANTDAFDAVNNMHRGKWYRMRSFVDSLPEYYL